MQILADPSFYLTDTFKPKVWAKSGKSKGTKQAGEATLAPLTTASAADSKCHLKNVSLLFVVVWSAL